jgi:tRNA G18 (ribose-2'-O)-methylase SpoU
MATSLSDQEEPVVEEELDESTPFKANTVISIDELKLKRDDNIILVLGSEGEGVSRSINKLADYRVMIPPQLRKDHIGKYPFNMIDSLNVGVSAGVLIYHIRHLTKRS